MLLVIYLAAIALAKAETPLDDFGDLAPVATGMGITVPGVSVTLFLIKLARNIIRKGEGNTSSSRFTYMGGGMGYGDYSVRDNRTGREYKLSDNKRNTDWLNRKTDW